ncbi:hypothetical protein D1B31_15210 [Neobacillus notoginsengisoli]|uniref:Uncharacterized protein n=1 Tax=Neobacillus notoginsengisoli TaxID=1578198 RepID=A0A417YS48_9BACI|nr:hypothetical protein [Neobacillus notoginsengisoli]RHW38123.1 hypothetical protein D1B31_15210 [Neobacillus notoginsengisoli]
MTSKKFTYIVLAALLAGLFVTMYIIYTDFDSKWGLYFVIGYVVILLIWGLTFLVVAGSRLRKLRREEMRKRLGKFILLFAGLSVIQYGLYFFIKPAEAAQFQFGIPLGFALGFSFLDLMYSKNGRTE